MSTKEISPATIVNPFEPPRLIKLAHGLLVTLRKLHQREGGWDGETVGNVLVVQRFLRDAAVWIKDVERWYQANAVQSKNAPTNDASQDTQQRSDCFPGTCNRTD